MKKKILISVLCVVTLVCLIVVLLNQKPTIQVGDVWIELGDEKIIPAVFKVCTVYNEKLESEKTLDIFEIVAESPLVLQEVDKNLTFGEEFQSDVQIKVQGDFFGDIYYTIYNEKGEEIVEKSNKLALPAGEIEKCTVKISVFWGDEKNYIETASFFTVEFKYV